MRLESSASEPLSAAASSRCASKRSMATLPPELLGRVVESLRIDDLAGGLAFTYAARVCRAWRDAVNSSWRYQAAVIVAPEEGGLEHVAPAYTQAGTLASMHWASSPRTLRINPGVDTATPAAWRSLCRAHCASKECSSLAASVMEPLASSPSHLCSLYGAGRLGSGLVQDAQLALKSVAPSAWLAPDAMAALDDLLEAFAGRLRAELLDATTTSQGDPSSASGGSAGPSALPSSFDALLSAIETLLPAELAHAAVSELESATAHMGHTPEARTRRRCLFHSTASAAPFVGCEGVLAELMRLLEFLCVDLLGIAWESAEESAGASAGEAAGESAGESAGASAGASASIEGADPSEAGTRSAAAASAADEAEAPPWKRGVGLLRRVALARALTHDPAWASLHTSLFGTDGIAAAVEGWAAAASSSLPLSCMSTTGACVLPLTRAGLEATGRAERAHARYVSGSRAHTALPLPDASFEIDDVTVPVPLPIAQKLIERLEAWGASRVAFVRLNPDRDSNQLYPCAIAGELPGGVLAGIAFVQDMQD